MAYVPVTFGDLYSCALQTQQDLEDGKDEDAMVDELREAMINFSVMHRGNPCECGSNPCIAVIPRELMLQGAAERTDQRS